MSEFMLGDLPTVKENISRAPVEVVKVLHKLIFEEEGDRKNRKIFREFTGFQYDKDSDEYQNKVSCDLMNCFGLLNIKENAEFEKKEDAVKKICQLLIDITELTTYKDDNGVEDEEDDEELKG